MFHFRLVVGTFCPVYASSTSYTPILARRRYTAAIPTDQMPVMVCVLASFPTRAAYNTRPVDYLFRPLAHMAQAAALSCHALSRNQRIQSVFLAA